MVTLDFFNWLEKKIPEIQNSQFVYDPTETFSVGSDFTMVLAGGIGYDRYFRFDFIKKSVRKYLDKHIPDEDLKKSLKQAVSLHHG